MLHLKYFIKHPESQEENQKIFVDNNSYKFTIVH